jgi:hypothetical protein
VEAGAQAAAAAQAAGAAEAQTQGQAHTALQTQTPQELEEPTHLPEAVQELVLNGFPLKDVLVAFSAEMEDARGAASLEGLFDALLRRLVSWRDAQGAAPPTKRARSSSSSSSNA